MKISRPIRPLILATLVLAIIGIISVTAWQLRPLVREYCVRQGVLGQEPQSWWPASWKQEVKVRRKLLDPVTLEFVETPFSDVLDFLLDYTGLGINVDKDALNELGFDDGIPVSIRVQQVPLRSSLRLLLDQIQLSYLIENGSLVITSRSNAEARATAPTSPATPGFGLASIRSESQPVRREAAFAAAYDRPPTDVAVPQLIAALQDDSRDVRIDAVFALGEIGHDAEAAVPALVQILEGDDETLRACAIAALCNMGRMAWDKALKVINDPLTSFAIKYRDGLKPDVIEKVVHRATESLTEGDAESRLNAVTTLSAFHPHAQPAVSALCGLLDDSDGRVRLAAAQALWKIDRTAPAAAPKLIEVLTGQVSDVDPRSGYHTGIHGQILAFLLQTGQERTLDIQTLIDLLDNRDSGVRKYSAKLLGKHGPDALPAVPALTKLLDQPQADVRLDVATALLQIGPANARIVEELIDLLHDRDQHVHVPAIELLGQCGTEARMAVPELEDMVRNLDRKNDRWGIRRSVDRALQRITDVERHELMRREVNERP